MKLSLDFWNFRLPFVFFRYSGDHAPVLNMLAEVDYTAETIEPSSPTMDRGLDFSNSPLHTNNSTKTNNLASHRNNNVISDPSSKKLQIHSAGKPRSSDKQGVSRLDSTSSFGSNSSRGKSGESFELVDDYYSRDSTSSTEGLRKLRSESGSASELLQQQIVLTTDSDILTGVTTYEAVQVSFTNFYLYFLYPSPTPAQLNVVGGVYRNHPVLLSLHISCNCHSSFFVISSKTFYSCCCLSQIGQLQSFQVNIKEF